MNLGYQTFNVFFYIVLSFVLKNFAKSNKLKTIHKKLFKVFSILFLVSAILLAIPTGMRWYIKMIDAFVTPSLEVKRTEKLNQNTEIRISNIIDLIKRDTKIDTAKKRIDQRQAYRDLLQIDNEEIINYCLKTIPNETDINRKITMISLLGTRKNNSKDDKIVKLVVPIAKSKENSYLNVAAIIVLGKIHTTQSFDALMDILKNSTNERVVYVTIVSIGDHRNPGAIPILKEKESQRLPTIREAAKYSLKKITISNYIPDGVKNPKTYLDRKMNADRKEALQ